jgi:ubiquinone/menaquinone biosynthesis C-methylase UbiE
LLHLGCGSEPIPDWLSHFDEVRVDVNPDVKPHFVRDMLNLHDIGTFDVIYCCHALEHLYPYQVPRALAEFKRVLNPGGGVFVVVPDLEDVKPDTTMLMNCDLGPICGLDMFYGHHSSLESNPWMAHHCGFIESTLREALEQAGFEQVKMQRLANYNLCAAGAKAA